MNDPQHPSVRRWFWAGMLLTLAKLWLVRCQAIYAIGPADHDDRLFLQLADAPNLAAANKRISNILKKSAVAAGTGVDAVRTKRSRPLCITISSSIELS